MLKKSLEIFIYWVKVKVVKYRLFSVKMEEFYLFKATQNIFLNILHLIFIELKDIVKIIFLTPDCNSNMRIWINIMNLLKLFENA